MASLVLSGDTSGSITVSAPAVAGSTTQTLVNVTGTLAPIVSGTAVSASSTSVDFTGIPSWVKRITVMFSGVSTNGSSNFLVQIGSGSITNTGYASTSGAISNTATAGTTGFIQTQSVSSVLSYSGAYSIILLGSNLYVGSGTLVTSSAANNAFISGGTVTLSGALDRVRITTVNGTDTFDAGTINLLWE